MWNALMLHQPVEFDSSFYTSYMFLVSVSELLNTCGMKALPIRFCECRAAHLTWSMLPMHFIIRQARSYAGLKNYFFIMQNIIFIRWVVSKIIYIDKLPCTCNRLPRIFMMCLFFAIINRGLMVLVSTHTLLFMNSWIPMDWQRNTWKSQKRVVIVNLDGICFTGCNCSGVFYGICLPYKCRRVTIKGKTSRRRLNMRTRDTGGVSSVAMSLVAVYAL